MRRMTRKKKVALFPFFFSSKGAHEYLINFCGGNKSKKKNKIKWVLLICDVLLPRS